MSARSTWTPDGSTGASITWRQSSTPGPDDQHGYIVVRSAYQQYGDKSEAIWTGPDGRADFLADSGTVSLWVEDGVGLD